MKKIKMWASLLALGIGILITGVNAKAAPLTSSGTMKVNSSSYNNYSKVGGQDKCLSFTVPNGYKFVSIELLTDKSSTDFYLYDGADDLTSTRVFDELVYEGNKKTKTCTLTGGKTYYLNCVSSGDADIHIKIDALADDYPDDFTQARSISLGQNVSGKIELSGVGECDYFKFTTTGNKAWYEISVADNGKKSVTCYLYSEPFSSSEEDYFTVYSSETNSKLYSLTPNHTYYVKMYNYWGDATSYNLRVNEIKDEAGDDFTKAKKLTIGKAASGRIQANGDKDYYKVKTGKSDTAFRLYTACNSANTHINYTVYTGNTISQKLSAATNVYVYGGTPDVRFLTLKKNRTYYIEITGSQGTDYKLNFAKSSKEIKKVAPKQVKLYTPSYRYYRPYAEITWQNKAYYSGYEIWRSTKKSSGYKKIKTIKNTSYYYDYTVKHGRRYYYKVRYYVKNNGKVIGGKWSSVKSVKVK